MVGRPKEAAKMFDSQYFLEEQGRQKRQQLMAEAEVERLIKRTRPEGDTVKALVPYALALLTVVLAFAIF